MVVTAEVRITQSVHLQQVYNLYTTASGSPSPCGDHKKQCGDPMVSAAVPPSTAAVAGADQTGGYVCTPKSIERKRNKNAKLQGKKMRHSGYPTCISCALAAVLHGHLRLILVEAKLKHVRMKECRDWPTDIRMSVFCHYANYNGQSMNTLKEGKH